MFLGNFHLRFWVEELAPNRQNEGWSLEII